MCRLGFAGRVSRYCWIQKRVSDGAGSLLGLVASSAFFTLFHAPQLSHCLWKSDMFRAQNVLHWKALKPFWPKSKTCCLTLHSARTRRKGPLCQKAWPRLWAKKIRFMTWRKDSRMRWWGVTAEAAALSTVLTELFELCEIVDRTRFCHLTPRISGSSLPSTQCLQSVTAQPSTRQNSVAGSAKSNRCSSHSAVGCLAPHQELLHAAGPQRLARPGGTGPQTAVATRSGQLQRRTKAYKEPRRLQDHGVRLHRTGISMDASSSLADMDKDTAVTSTTAQRSARRHADAWKPRRVLGAKGTLFSAERTGRNAQAEQDDDEILRQQLEALGAVKTPSSAGELHPPVMSSPSPFLKGTGLLLPFTACAMASEFAGGRLWIGPYELYSAQYLPCM